MATAARRTRSVDPSEVSARLQAGEAHLFGLRTDVERRCCGAPPGAIPVSFAEAAIRPGGAGAIYLCQHAVRSKLTLLAGAGEAAGGFAAWKRAGLPVEKAG